MIANTPAPPYYAVIFTSVRTPGDNGYAEMAGKMLQLARNQDGFLGIESARENLGITVSYWRDLKAIQKWKENAEHQDAQKEGRKLWYAAFTTRITRVEKEYSFSATNPKK